MRRVIYYYLIPFVGLFLSLLLHAFSGESIHSRTGNMLIAFVFALAGALLIGTFCYWYDTRWGPRKSRRILSRSPFKELESFGFRRIDDFYAGTVNGYVVMVSFSWQGGRYAITVQALFDPACSSGGFMTLQQLRDLAEKVRPEGYHQHLFEWERNAAGYRLEFRFIPPNHEKVLQTAEVLTKILETKLLKPISLEETERMLPALRKWISERKEEQGFI